MRAHETYRLKAVKIVFFFFVIGALTSLSVYNTSVYRSAGIGDTASVLDDTHMIADRALGRLHGALLTDTDSRIHALSGVPSPGGGGSDVKHRSYFDGYKVFGDHFGRE